MYAIRSYYAAVFMTAVTTTYLFFAPEGFALSKEISYPIGAILSVFSVVLFIFYKRKYSAGVPVEA